MSEHETQPPAVDLPSDTANGGRPVSLTPAPPPVPGLSQLGVPSGSGASFPAGLPPLPEVPSVPAADAVEPQSHSAPAASASDGLSGPQSPANLWRQSVPRHQHDHFGPPPPAMPYTGPGSSEQSFASPGSSEQSFASPGSSEQAYPKHAYAGLTPPGVGPSDQSDQAAPDSSPQYPSGPGPGPGPTPALARLGWVLVLAALALILMLGSGLVGGLVARSLGDDPAPFGARNNGDPVPVVDRSSLAEIAAAVQNSVVAISAETGEGSGVVLSADGFILTNNHVVESAVDGAVSVVFANGRSGEGTVVGTDLKTDLAVLRVDGVDDLSPATFGDSSVMRVGDTVLALGSPLGLQGSVTAGIISAQNRTIQVGDQQDLSGADGGAGSSMSGLLQTDAPINPGNSGGALINTKGEVIGINTAIATSGQGAGNIGVGFAIPSSKAIRVAETLRRGEQVSHPSVGLTVTRSDDGGAAVVAVGEGTPAEEAGLQQGDVIVRAGDTTVNDADDLVAAVQSSEVGAQMALTYLRDGDEDVVTVTLVEAP